MSEERVPFRPEEFDSWSQEQMTDPFAMYDEVRSRCPVAHSKHHGGFAYVSTFEGAKKVLSTFASFSSRNGMVLPPRPERTYPSDLDPPVQTRYRRAINPNFTREEAEKVRPRFEQLVDEAIDGFILKGSADLANDLVRPVLPSIVMPMIGVPVEDHPKIRRWIEPIMRDRVSNPRAVVQAVNEMTAYLEALAERRRSMPPQHDAVGSLLLLKDGDQLVSNNVVARVLIAVLLGGLDTTTATAVDSLLYLSRHPEDAERLRSGEVPWATAIEEFLRLFSPATAVLRTVVADTELEGTALKQDEFIVALLGAANRDPRHFPDANKCVLDRDKNDHLTFGSGAHVCLGRFLARVEIEVFLRAVLARMPDFKPVEGFQPEYWTTSTRAMKSLPVRFTPGQLKQRAAT